GSDYLEKSIRLAKTYFNQVSLEIFPCDTPEYARLAASGASGLSLYQETYQEGAYGEAHPHGPKNNYTYRLDSADRALSAGFKKMGLGCLLGLSDWRLDIALCVLHMVYLQKKYWRAELSMSFPRLRANQQRYPVSDHDLHQIICAVRIFLPTINLVLSTRESSSLRDTLIHSGITMISAGSKTNPGGYSDIVSSSQFDISDHRSLAEVSKMLSENGLFPVLKDWSSVF
ncbi:MAG: 2-iminoacetate synthase ThiH, partial [Candidatus Margulisiibacteriota bacterium]